VVKAVAIGRDFNIRCASLIRDCMTDGGRCSVTGKFGFFSPSTLPATSSVLRVWVAISGVAVFSGALEVD